MTTDTTKASYWLNWRFLLCAIWILVAMIFASFLIWKYEDFNKSKRERREDQSESTASALKDRAWRTCFKGVQPAWLLAFRMFAFVFLASLLIANVSLDGGGIFFFYTQWTFALVTVYFGVATALSIYGCCQYRTRVVGDAVASAALDVEGGTYVAPSLNGDVNIPDNSKSLDNVQQNTASCRTANICSYAFQILFQMCAGAAMLTDFVFWIILVPFLMSADYRLNFLDVCLHTLNVVFLLGDTILNSLEFPFFRLAYFVLWTGIFVIFQWIIHACVSMWWPYPFLDLSSPFAPLWYLAVGIMHLPCYGIFALIHKTKHFWFMRSFPNSYQTLDHCTWQLHTLMIHARTVA